MKFFKLFFVFCVFLNLNLSFGEEISVFNQNSQKNIYQNIAPSDENTDYEKDFSDPFISQYNLVLTSDDYKNELFVGEVFSIKLYAKTAEQTDFDFKFDFKQNDILWLNENAKWLKINDTYETTLYFQALSANAKFEQIIVSLTRNQKAFTSANLLLNPFSFKRINADNNYANLVASSLEVRKVKTNTFDDKNIIMMLELYATNANLKNFKMSNLNKQGIENLKGDFNASNAFYYAIFPAHKTNFEFSYFNKEKESLENFNLKLKLSDEDLSTQSDLNPTNRDFNVYKQYAFFAAAFIFALFFAFNRNFIVLGLAILCFALAFLVNTTSQSAILKNGARVKILPTEPSTYFYTSEKNEKVEVIGKRENYIEILLENGKIGWVNKADLSKD